MRTLDAVATPASFVTRITTTPVINVSQCVVKHPVTGDLYMDQPDTNSSKYQSLTLGRYSRTGEPLDSMRLLNAGHGTVFDLQVDGGRTYVWLSWSRDLAGTMLNHLVRFPYTPGVTWDRSAKEIEQVDDFGGYVNAMFDWANGNVAFRESWGTTDRYTLRRVADVLAGRNIPIARIDLRQGPPSMQGFCTIDDHFYRMTGTSDGKDPRRVTRYEWMTPGVEDVIDLEPLVDPDPAAGAFREPEGISLYRDRLGNPHLLVNLVTGPHAHRRHNVWSISSVPANLTAPPAPTQVTRLADLATPGWYWVSGHELAHMTDIPLALRVPFDAEVPVAVSPPGSSGQFVQEVRLGGATYWRVAPDGAWLLD